MEFIFLGLIVALLCWGSHHLQLDDVLGKNFPNFFKSKYSLRRDYYRNVYLKSDAWQRKRYIVMKRDRWRCVYCGANATQVHHTRYARNIGNEPINWLVSVCNCCHDSIHSKGPVHRNKNNAGGDYLKQRQKDLWGKSF
ncbi:MAG TPA: hypothetical protein VLC98_00980 [Phnomibacter sp.]|nr:hypothetical protein [Phnomibacter sp.]